MLPKFTDSNQPRYHQYVPYSKLDWRVATHSNLSE